MGLSNRILGLILLLIGGYVGYTIYIGDLTILINSTFLKGIGGLLIFLIGFLSLLLIRTGFNLLRNKQTDNDETINHNSNVLENEAKIAEAFDILEQNKNVSSTNTSNNQNTTKQKVKNGMIVKYRIKSIGTDQSEVIPAGTESEARRIIKAKYPTMDIHIINVMYNYE